MKALVCGYGRMGKCIHNGMQKLDFEVVAIDSYSEANKNFPETKFICTPEFEDIEKAINYFQPDILICSLPYHQLLKVAEYAIAKGIRYCDLGGRVDVSKKINDLAAKQAKKPVITDLGLAPGLVNILAEWGYSTVGEGVDTVNMFVGGLPEIKFNPPLNYAVTWSIDGLINEYKDNCEVLVDGELRSVAGMEGCQKVDFGLFEDENLEAFYTSGGAAHTIETMQERGVKNCSYKTIRYEGHRDLVKFLIRDCDLTSNCLESIFETGCQNQYGDIVLVKAEVKAKDLTWNKEVIVGYDHQFTAMQKSTSYSIASVAALMGEGKLDGNYNQLNYSDIPFEDFKNNLSKLGINI